MVVSENLGWRRTRYAPSRCVQPTAHVWVLTATNVAQHKTVNLKYYGGFFVIFFKELDVRFPSMNFVDDTAIFAMLLLHCWAASLGGEAAGELLSKAGG